MMNTARDFESDFFVVSKQCRNQSEDDGWFNDTSHKAALYVAKEVLIEVVGPRKMVFAGFKSRTSEFTAYTGLLMFS